MGADLLNEGVDDGAAPAGVGSAYEHPVLMAEFGRSYGIFGEVVVYFNLPVFEAWLQVWPLLTGVACPRSLSQLL